MISVDNLEDNTRFAKEHDADYPILSDVTKEIATKYGVLGPPGSPTLDVLHRPDGKILHIDNAVKPASSGPDMVAKLAELNIAKRSNHAIESRSALFIAALFLSGVNRVRRSRIDPVPACQPPRLRAFSRRPTRPPTLPIRESARDSAVARG
jgi:hypothetical protein